ncbi:MAG: ATP phosphoribosyltransferase regulatory subunit [Thiohalocapsa sp.]|uniref:ATP phosphoribosyltransferase regulatory subunit n=1 Tax=Thiohalocapsa sp. TaxID=2497641 RepID=UPI0025F63369|nr:ATP phosphoribosyltransferase regulatory subunit [Thiohalocapsa sp.]MCG6943232.1 ATP phosphoribosyltransferase regulatory subunit [Thiohalocapsa sp.]
MNEERWRLPDGIDEVLPPEAARVEALRRELLDLYGSWGYELVIPPFIDYLDSLLTGTGSDLDLRTFKLTDQVSGRLLGVRADMTPQVARIDAHRLRREAPTRLCYLGTVLHTRSDGFAGSRSPLQIGAEIFGHDGMESDVEILRLFVATLAVAGIDNAYLDLGHVGIFRGLARQAGLDRGQEMALFDALQRKAIPEIHELIDQAGVAPAVGDMLLVLPELNGDDALQRAGHALAAADAPVQAALERLRRVAEETARWLPALSVHFDLAELRGYNYKTGIVFAAFVPGWGLEIGRGGRYDNIGHVFGRERPAVGFSTDLKGLIAQAAPREVPASASASPVLAPWSTDAALQAAVAELRRAGRRVIQQLPGSAAEISEAAEVLVETAGGWTLRRAADATDES